MTLTVAHTRQVTVTRTICGVDISSVSLAARIGRGGVAASFANTAEGIAELAAFCHTHHAELVAMEATGGYKQQAFALLWERGLPVAILNPRRSSLRSASVKLFFSRLPFTYSLTCGATSRSRNASINFSS